MYRLIKESEHLKDLEAANYDVRVDGRTGFLNSHPPSQFTMKLGTGGSPSGGLIPHITNGFLISHPHS
jgi:hypothetical protein